MNARSPAGTQLRDYLQPSVYVLLLPLESEIVKPMINSKLAVDVLPGEAQVPDAEGALLANRSDKGVGKHLLALQVIVQCPEGGRFLRGADSFQAVCGNWYGRCVPQWEMMQPEMISPLERGKPCKCKRGILIWRRYFLVTY